MRDNVAAASWIKLAAEQEHARAQFNLGGMYERGQGVYQDYSEAARWYGEGSAPGRRRGAVQARNDA